MIILSSGANLLLFSQGGSFKSAIYYPNCCNERSFFRFEALNGISSERFRASFLGWQFSKMNYISINHPISLSMVQVF